MNLSRGWGTRDYGIVREENGETFSRDELWTQNLALGYVNISLDY